MKAYVMSLMVLSSLFIYSQNENVQEVYIMGTMHTVPKIVKHSYKPMLKRALDYSPEAIYMESPRATDSLSWDYLKDGWSEKYKAFYNLSDSLSKTFKPNIKRFDSIISIPFNELKTKDLDYLILCFASQRDHANYEFYNYIKTYGLHGAEKPTRHEDGDLTFKLALELNIKTLFSIDDQRTNGKYHDAWRNCMREGMSNGNNAILKRLNKKDYNAAMFPALFRGLGKHTNTRKSLLRIHKINSFGYVQVKTQGCIDGQHYWNERNRRMAQNIGEQVLASGLERNIVIVGAGHVIGLEEELKANFPQLKIILMQD